jgi:hypothetical protein
MLHPTASELKRERDLLQSHEIVSEERPGSDMRVKLAPKHAGSPTGQPEEDRSGPNVFLPFVSIHQRCVSTN